MGLVNRLTKKHNTGLFSIVAPVEQPTIRVMGDDAFFQDVQVVHYQLFDFRDSHNEEVFDQKHDDLYPLFQDFGPVDASEAHDADEFSDFENEELFGVEDDDLLEPEDHFEHLALQKRLLAYDCLPELTSQANKAGVVLYESHKPLTDFHDDYLVLEAKDEHALQYIEHALDADKSEEFINASAYDSFVKTNESEMYSTRLHKRMHSVRERYLDGESVDGLCSEVVGAIAQSPLHKELAARIADQYFPGGFEGLSEYFASLEMNTQWKFLEESQEVHKFLLERLTPYMRKLRENAQNGE